MSEAGNCEYHIELFRIRDDGSIESRRFPPPFSEVAAAVAAGEHYVSGTGFWFEVVREDGRPVASGGTTGVSDSVP